MGDLDKLCLKVLISLKKNQLKLDFLLFMDSTNLVIMQAMILFLLA